MRRYRPPHQERQILTLLRHYGINQRKVAGALNVTEATVSMWINGKRKASEDHLTQLRNLQYWVSYKKKINKIPPDLQ